MRESAKSLQTTPSCNEESNNIDEGCVKEIELSTTSIQIKKNKRRSHKKRDSENVQTVHGSENPPERKMNRKARRSSSQHNRTA
jgi:hypothetical protein